MMFTPDYVVGLTDGEGSFTVYLKDPASGTPRNRRVRAEPKFFLKLIEKDKTILDGLRKFFGCGSVYFQKDVRKNHQHCYRYEVGNRHDIAQKIIPFFRKHPLHFPSKAKDFQIFCDIFERIMRNDHATDDGLINLRAIKAGMH